MISDTATETVYRFIARDNAIRAAGKKPPWNATHRIVEYAIKHHLLTDPTVTQWLQTVAADADIWLSHRLLEIVQALVGSGHEEGAHSLYRCVLGLDDPARWTQVIPSLVQDGMLVRVGFESILSRPALIAQSPDTWGRTACELLSRINIEHQRREWPSHLRLMAAFANDFDRRLDVDQPFVVNYDDSPSLWFFDRNKLHGPRMLIASALAQALRDAAQFADSGKFHRIAEGLIGSRFAIGVGLVLATLLDCLQGKMPRLDWHVDEAVWLLSSDAAHEHVSLEGFRRLLRRALARPNPETAATLADAIRRSPSLQSTRIRELADLTDWGILTPDETTAVAEKFREGELYQPIDPREHSAIVSTEWAPDDRDAAVSWPYAEDADAIRLLARITPQPAPDKPLEVFERDVRNSLAALRTVLSRPECDSEAWSGEILGWCKRALSDLRTLEQRRRESNSGASDLSASEWEEILNADMPWWKGRVEAALRIVSEPPPNTHHENRSGLAWGTADRLFQSLCYLDEALAVNGAGPFAALRERLDTAIDAAWPRWPPFTRATALVVLRPWYWFQLPKIRRRLSDLAESETDPLVAQHAVDRILDVGGSEMSQNIERFLARAESIADFGRTVNQFGQHLGHAALVKVGRSEVSPETIDLAGLFDRVQQSPPTDEKTRKNLIQGTLRGAGEFLQDAKDRTQAIASAWLSIVEWAVAQWPGFGRSVDDEEQFPFLPITLVLKLPWPEPIWRYLINGLSDTLVRLIREGSLGDYYMLHHELRELLESNKDPRSVECGPTSHEIPDTLALALCRASADRVLSWRGLKKTTMDLAWVSALSGQETRDLIRTAFDAALDRDYLRRELPPIIDRLAEAGSMGTATELRLYLRRN